MEHYTTRERPGHEVEPIVLKELDHWEKCAAAVSLVTLLLADGWEPINPSTDPRVIALDFFAKDLSMRKAIDDILPAPQKAGSTHTAH